LLEMDDVQWCFAKGRRSECGCAHVIEEEKAG
jgi:hypothetical protein